MANEQGVAIATKRKAANRARRAIGRRVREACSLSGQADYLAKTPRKIGGGFAMDAEGGRRVETLDRTELSPCACPLWQG
jgi:hypothetical protein